MIKCAYLPMVMDHCVMWVNLADYEVRSTKPSYYNDYFIEWAELPNDTIYRYNDLPAKIDLVTGKLSYSHRYG